MDLKKAVTTRKGARYFSRKKADWRKVIRAIDYARFAPAIDNKFVNKFILVSDRKKIEMLADAAQQSFIDEASYVVVVVSDPSYVVTTYPERGERFVAQQSGSAIQNFLLGLNEQKLVTTWIGYFSEDLVKNILSIPGSLTVEAIFPVGLASKVKHQKVQKPLDLENTIFYDKWKNKEMVPNTRVTVDNL
jgi:nitroreductase